MHKTWNWVGVVGIMGVVVGCEGSRVGGSERASTVAAIRTQTPTEEESVELRGEVIKKPWSKSMESWVAGGSDYYVLAVDEACLEGLELPEGWRTAREGVILRASEEVDEDALEGWVGERVVLRGVFVEGTVPEPAHPMEQRPIVQQPMGLGGSVAEPTRGQGFRVLEGSLRSE